MPLCLYVYEYWDSKIISVFMQIIRADHQICPTII